MALKLSRAAGCRVIITSSSDTKLETVRRLSGIGPISTINYAENPAGTLKQLNSMVELEWIT